MSWCLIPASVKTSAILMSSPLARARLSSRNYCQIIPSSQTFGFRFDGFDCLFIFGPFRLCQIQGHKCRGSAEIWNMLKPLLRVPCFGDNRRKLSCVESCLLGLTTLGRFMLVRMIALIGSQDCKADSFIT